MIIKILKLDRTYVYINIFNLNLAKTCVRKQENSPSHPNTADERSQNLPVSANHYLAYDAITRSLDITSIRNC